MADDDDKAALWGRFKADHPVGSAVRGTVIKTRHFGVFVDLAVPFTALLLIPYIAPIGAPKRFPEDYPQEGDTIEAYIRILADEAPPKIGQIGLTQEPGAGE